VQEARAKPLADVGPPTKEEKDNVGNTNNKLNGTTVDYTLRRLARDAPEMLDTNCAVRTALSMLLQLARAREVNLLSYTGVGDDFNRFNDKPSDGLPSHLRYTFLFCVVRKSLANFAFLR
jgi:hypothetical protein